MKRSLPGSSTLPGTLSRHAVAWLAWAVGLWGLYLLFVFPSVTPVELAVGAAVAALAATAAVAIRAQGLLGYRLELRMLLGAWRVPLQTVRDFGILTLVLLRRLAGRDAGGAFRAVPFRGGGSDPESRARRAFVTTAGTIAPNTIVVSIDQERDLMLLHELVPGRSPGVPL